MGREKKRPGRKGIFLRTFRPILAILLLIIAFYTIVLQQSLLGNLKANAVEVFDGQVLNRTLYVQSELSSRVVAVNNSAKLITAKAETFAAQEGVTLETVWGNATFNQALLRLMMEDVIGTLRTCGTTGIFLVLDGPARDEGVGLGQKAGIYLRSSSPNVYDSGNAGLLLERGISTLSKEWQIPLDSYWKSAFVFSEQGTISDYFYRPLEAAKQETGLGRPVKPSNFGYWCYGKILNSSDQNIFTYSVPLVAADGTVFGVLGVGDGEGQLSRSLDYQELGEDSGYLLAKSRDGAFFDPMLYSGISHNKNALLSVKLGAERSNLDPVTYLSGGSLEEGTLCAGVQQLNLYAPNTPFDEEGWYIIGVQNRDRLLTAYDDAYGQLLILAMVALALGILGVFSTSRLITSPITRLMEELRRKDPNRPIRLQRLGVEEIDELVDSIESLSARVAEAFSRVSAIVEMSDSGVGLFEWKQENNLVFCSKGLYEMLGWPPRQGSNGYVNAGDFVSRLEALERQKDPEEPGLYCLNGGENGRRWFRLNRRQEGGSLLGVLTDVTAAVLEKRQIEWERDFDSLTNLHNRRAFEERGKALFAEPAALKIAALLVWDLDNLKYINDTYGHTAGDDYIIALADCLRLFEGEGMLAARRSGDEFTVLIYGKEDEAAIMAVVDGIWDRVREALIPLPNGNSYKLRVSAGMSWCPRDSDQLNLLFQYADFAMYTAKHSHKGTMEQFDLKIYEQNRLLLQGQEEFNNLLEHALVRYMLQPIISVADGSIYGYEMLMRSELELFRSPLDILRMAHSQSRLYDLEVLTWFEAMKTFVDLDKKGLLASNSRVFINSIANQLLRTDMALLFQKTYADYLSRLVCEFTEEEQGNPDSTLAKKYLLGSWGSMLAVDDYGCGYNSESMLLEISPDIVKIDMNIVRNIHQDSSRQRLVKNLISYARERYMLVLGEGVETREEMETLVALGVDLLQGYYLAYPSYEVAPPAREAIAELAKLSEIYYQSKTNAADGGAGFSQRPQR